MNNLIKSLKKVSNHFAIFVFFFFCCGFSFHLTAQECVENRSVSVVFVFDVSTSMLDNDVDGSPKLSSARNFAIAVTNALVSAGVNVEGYIQPFCGNYSNDGGATCYLTPVPVVSWTSASNIINAFSGGIAVCGGTALNHAIVYGTQILRARSTSNLKLLLLITDGMDASDCGIAGSPSVALSGGDITSRLVFVGPSGGSLPGIASGAGSTCQALNATAGSLNSLVQNIKDAICINHRPVANFTKSTNNLILGTQGFEINFNGSASSDQETASSSLTYEWTFTRPDGSTFSRSDRTFNQTFTDNELNHGTPQTANYSVRLRVRDAKGVWSNPATQSFILTGSPPNVTLSSSPASPIAANITAAIIANPENDVDGGPMTFQWTVLNTPVGGVPPTDLTLRQMPFSTQEENITTYSDGTTDFRTLWHFECRATDDEAVSDIKSFQIRVKNLAPRIELVGNQEIDVNQTIQVQTNILTDDDGGNLSFKWDIIQAPNSAPIVVQSDYATGATLSIPTTENFAGTWRFRLTATDNEGEEKSEEYSVLVDGLPVAEISGPLSTIGSLSGFPMTLDGSASYDPDSPTDTPNHSHSTSDPPVQDISGGIVSYSWSLIDAPLDNPNLFSLGRVDEVLGIYGGGATLEIPLSKRLTPGYYTFLLQVEDAEGNEVSTEFQVDVTEEESKPFAIIIPPYTIQYVDGLTNALSSDISFNGSISFDADNLLSSPISQGITNYEWSILESPSSCVLFPTLPTGASATNATLFPAGTILDPTCQGLWKVGLKVTDDDPIPKINDPLAESVVVIGNCPANICIDYPTTLFPQIVQLTDATDVLIYFHLNSILYSDPAALFGTIASLEIFYEAETTPFYSTLDPNLYPTNLGGFLIFHWNGFGNSRERPKPGHYHIRLRLMDQSMTTLLGGDDQMNAIIIAVADPVILATSEKYVSRDQLVAGTDLLNINYSITGGAVPDQLWWRVYDAGNGLVSQGTIPNPPNVGSFGWDGRGVGAVVLPAGDYKIELETLRGGVSMGKSPKHDFKVVEADIDADRNRDGNIDNTTDDMNEETWTITSGAIFNVNYDRDGTRTAGGIPIGDAIHIDDSGTPGNEDKIIDNVNDALDITPFIIRKIMDNFPPTFQVFLKVGELEDIQSIHVFKKIAAGESAIWGGLGSRVGGAAEPIEIDITQYVNPASPSFQGNPASGDCNFGLEGLFFRNTGSLNTFNGVIDLTVELRDGATTIGSDMIQMKVAPWLMASHRQPSLEVWVENDPRNVEMRLNASAGAGYFGLDNSTQMQTVSGADAGSQWFQDHLEIGYYKRPGGPENHCVFRLPYDNTASGVPPVWPLQNLLSSQTSEFQLNANFGTLTPSGDYGGNLELLPPNSVNKNGKMIMGNIRSPQLFTFLQSQEVQTPFEVNTDWLHVGHIDEVFGFSGIENQMIVADPTDAYALLTAIPVGDRGKRVFFAKGIDPISGTVPSVNPAANRINTGINHLGGTAWKFIRIYDGTGAGQVARVIDWQNGFLEIDRVWVTGSDILPFGAGQYGTWVFSNAPHTPTWNATPAVGDKFVLVEDSQFWGANATPAIITVKEILADTDLENLNKITIQNEIDAMKLQIQTQNGLPMSFIKVPTIYIGDATVFHPDGRCIALTPGLANFQSVKGNLYFPRQFGPRNAAGEDIFERTTLTRIPNALFTDDWNLYHRLSGEVHCGTNTKRVFPLFNWWD